MKNYFDYQPYQTEDFLRDWAFRQWIKSPTPEMTAFWKGLIRTYPHLLKHFQEAQILAQSMEVSWNSFSDEYTDQLFGRIKPFLTPPAASTTWLSRSYPWAAAACSILLIGTVVGYYFFTDRHFQTDFAQTKVITLYDGSVATLNANSQLHMPSRYEWLQSRKVKLEGEAYFDVAKQPLKKGFKKFTVQTERVSVEVIGTHFNLYARPFKTIVLLDEGSIRLTDRENPKPILMKPGQVIEMSANKKAFKVAASPIEKSIAISDWRNNRLVFNDTDMLELAHRFEEIYGVQLILTDSTFQDQEFRGELPVTNMKEALFILETAFDRKSIKDGNKIHFVKE